MLLLYLQYGVQSVNSQFTKYYFMFSVYTCCDIWWSFHGFYPVRDVIVMYCLVCASGPAPVHIESALKFIFNEHIYYLKHHVLHAPLYYLLTSDVCIHVWMMFVSVNGGL